MADQTPNDVFFWVSGISQRSSKRVRRGVIGGPVSDTIDNEYLKNLLEEARLSNIEATGAVDILSAANAEQSIIGYMVVEVAGSWENVWTRASAQRR